MLFHEVALVSGAVAAASGRTEKRELLAEVLRGASADEVRPLIGFLIGEPRQGRIGIGWRTLSAIETRSADAPTLTVDAVDSALEQLASVGGAGSATRRRQLLGSLLGRATGSETDLLTRLLTGELRQGALAGVVTDAIAVAWNVPVAAVRRAVMLGGRLDEVGVLAATGGAAAVSEVALVPGRPLQPMLASSATDVREAVLALGEVSVEWKLDGIRIQTHLVDGEVRVWSRNLNDLTDRVPAVVEAVRSMPARRLVLDGEALAFDAAGRPRLFQDTVRRDEADGPGLRPFFFDLVHVDGVDLVDRPLSERSPRLDELVGRHRVPATRTDDPDEAGSVLAAALAAGHEGVVVKQIDSPYQAGRRGSVWRKVKPVHTLDLVVLAAEWGHGRRTGWLSNLHLGARDPSGGYVMVGKTFKGLTDELLAWQTARFTELAVDDVAPPGPGTVRVRPEQVVEVALDGVQRSTRYPGGVALRFARVVRYRTDRDAVGADTIDAVRELLAG